MVTLEEKLELQRLAMLIERLTEKIGELEEKTRGSASTD